jgi:hypothetical protein
VVGWRFAGLLVNQHKIRFAIRKLNKDGSLLHNPDIAASSFD